MATISVTSSPVQIDNGTGVELQITNTGTADVRVGKGATGKRGQTVRPGGFLRYEPEGSPVYAASDSSSTLNVVTSTAPVFTNLNATVAANTAAIAALPATYAPKSAWFSQLATPFVIPHRGGSLVRPENTIEAFRSCFAQGWACMEGGDVHVLADGGLAVMHDTTVDRTTSSSGNVSAYSTIDWKTLVVDSPTFLGGNVWGNLKPPFLSEILAEFGGKTVLVIESKSGTGVGQKTVDAIVAARLEKSVLHNSFILADCQLAAAAGIASCFNGTAAQIQSNAAAMLASGVAYGAVTDVSTVTNAAITNLITAGVKVIMGPTNRQNEYDRWVSLGVVGMYSDDPLYFSKQTSRYRRTVAPWTLSGTYYHGHLEAGSGQTLAGRGGFTGSAGAYRWQPTPDGPVLVGGMSPVASPTSYTLTVPITFDTLGNDTSRWAGILFGATSDLAVNMTGQAQENHYLVLVRANGQMGVYKRVSGVDTQLGSTISGAAVSAGATTTVTITVTSGNVTVSRDGGTAVSTSDTTYRGGYFYLHRNSNGTSGLVVSFGNVTVT